MRSSCASSHPAPKMQRAIPDRPRHVPQNASCGCRWAQGRFIFSRRWGTSHEVSTRWHGRTSFASLEYWRRNGRYTSTRWTATSIDRCKWGKHERHHRGVDAIQCWHCRNAKIIIWHSELRLTISWDKANQAKCSILIIFTRRIKIKMKYNDGNKRTISIHEGETYSPVHSFNFFTELSMWSIPISSKKRFQIEKLYNLPKAKCKKQSGLLKSCAKIISCFYERPGNRGSVLLILNITVCMLCKEMLRFPMMHL